MSLAEVLAPEVLMVVVAMVQAVALPDVAAVTVVPEVVPLVAITVEVVVRRDPTEVIEEEVVVSEVRKALAAAGLVPVAQIAVAQIAVAQIAAAQIAVAQIVAAPAGEVLAVAMPVVEEAILRGSLLKKPPRRIAL
jgi:hypothetical protein